MSSSIPPPPAPPPGNNPPNDGDTKAVSREIEAKVAPKDAEEATGAAGSSENDSGSSALDRWIESMEPRLLPRKRKRLREASGYRETLAIFCKRCRVRASGSKSTKDLFVKEHEDFKVVGTHFLAHWAKHHEPWPADDDKTQGHSARNSAQE